MVIMLENIQTVPFKLNFKRKLIILSTDESNNQNN